MASPEQPQAQTHSEEMRAGVRAMEQSDRGPGEGGPVYSMKIAEEPRDNLPSRDQAWTP